MIKLLYVFVTPSQALNTSKTAIFVVTEMQLKGFIFRLLISATSFLNPLNEKLVIFIVNFFKKIITGKIALHNQISFVSVTLLCLQLLYVIKNQVNSNKINIILFYEI